MSQRTPLHAKYKIVFRPGKAVTKVALLGVIVLSTVALIAIGSAVDKAGDRAEALRAQAAAEEREKAKLEQDIEALGSSDSIEQIAGEEWGWVDPDTIIFVNGEG